MLEKPQTSNPRGVQETASFAEIFAQMANIRQTSIFSNIYVCVQHLKNGKLYIEAAKMTFAYY